MTWKDSREQNRDLKTKTMANISKSRKITSKKATSISRKKAEPHTLARTKRPALKVAKNPNGFQEIRELIDLLKKNDLAVLEFQQGDLKITLKTPTGATGGGSLIHPQQIASPAPSSTTLPTPEKASPTEPAKGNYKEITSPMVGTFYASPSPDAPSFVEPGKSVGADTVVCIIEAMKVMNEIKAEIDGKIVEVVAENGKPVQFGQVLFRVS